MNNLKWLIIKIENDRSNINDISLKVFDKYLIYFKLACGKPIFQIFKENFLWKRKDSSILKFCQFASPFEHLFDNWLGLTIEISKCIWNSEKVISHIK